MSEKPQHVLEESLKAINKPLKALKNLKDQITAVTGGKESFQSLDWLQNKITEGIIQKRCLESGVLIQNVQSKEDVKNKGTSWEKIVYPEHNTGDFVSGAILTTSVDYFLKRNAKFAEIVKPTDILPASVKNITAQGLEYTRSEKGYVDANGNILSFNQMGSITITDANLQANKAGEKNQGDSSQSNWNEVGNASISASIEEMDKGKAEALGKSAERFVMGTVGRCYTATGRALEAVYGRFIPASHSRSAYMAAPILDRHPKFKKIQMKQSELPTLPRGAVVVWNNGPGHPHGHISIALGGGMEASDHKIRQYTWPYLKPNVYIPVA